MELAEGGTFQQNITSFPSPSCERNSVQWTGRFEQPTASALTLEFRQCTITGLGCVSCAPTSLAQLALTFIENCDGFTTLFPNESVPRVYFTTVKQR